MKSILLSVFAIILSAASMTLYFFKFSPVGIDAVSYIGAIGTFITISITVLVGFQIYRAYEIKKDLENFRVSIAEVERIKEALTKFENESRGTFHLIIGGIFAKEQSSCSDSFINTLESINYFLKCDYKKIDFAFDDLKASILNLQPGWFATGTPSQINEIVDDLNKRTGDIEQKITGNQNYFTIKYRFEKIMKAYNERAENCRNNISVTHEERLYLNNV